MVGLDRSADRIKDKDIEMSDSADNRHCPEGRTDYPDAGIDGYATFV